MGKHSNENDSGNHDYIVVIDAGSKGSRAHLYKSLRVGNETVSGDAKRGWREEFEPSTTKTTNYLPIELVKNKKIKPGIASFSGHEKKLGKHYMGKLLESMEDHIPKDQISRTPIFLHATGGMRLLRPEQQTTILNYICEYIKDHSDFFLPDCATHINAISGETEGIYAWLGLNYRYGVFEPEIERQSYGILDMGGVSSQIAFEPTDSHDNSNVLYKIDLDYSGLDAQQYEVFSQTLMSGMHQARSKYDESLLANSSLVDPCLPTGYVKTITSKDGLKADIEGEADFKKCVNSLFEILETTTVDKYCDPNDSTKTSSCSLSGELPKMDFNYHRFIGINEIYSNLKKHVNYKEFYENTQKVCQSSYADLLQKEEFQLEEVSPELCFKASWIINVLHYGVDFPRYGIDDTDEQKKTYTETIDENFKILDEYSWTLGRAVLYTYYETAQRLHGIETPHVGYYEPSSSVFVSGGEAPGIPSRPFYEKSNAYSYDSDDDDDYDDDHDHDHDHDHDRQNKHKGDEHHDNDSDDEGDEKNDDWDDVLEEHRLWGSLLFLFILLIIAYLLMGKTKRQSIKDTFKRLVNQRFRTNVYAPVEVTREDLELGDVDHLVEEESNNTTRNNKNTREDSLDLSE